MKKVKLQPIATFIGEDYIVAAGGRQQLQAAISVLKEIDRSGPELGDYLKIPCFETTAEDTLSCDTGDIDELQAILTELEAFYNATE